MRVMLLVTDHQRGGTPLRLARLAVGLRDAGIAVYAGCLAPPGPVTAELAAQGITTFSCQARGVWDGSAVCRLAGHVRRLAPDLIHSTLMHANVAARLVGCLARVPVVTSTATIEVERRWHLWVERLTARLDRGHIVNSRSLAHHAQEAFGRPAHRVFVVPPLVAPPRVPDRAQARAALGIGADEFVAVWVGRLDPVKRVGIIVRCAEQMACARCRLLLVGDGPDRTRLEGLLRQSPAADRVRLLGWQDDPGLALGAADVFLFPSLTEGMPNAVLEAMWAGLPVVAADLPALRELAGEESGLRLVTEAAPEAFAAVLRELRDDEVGRRALALRARAWARSHLDPAAAIRAHIAVYRRILAGSEH